MTVLMIEMVTSVAEAIAAIAASLIAARSLNTWRREFIGKRRAEVAEEILVLFYEARSKLQDARTGRMSQSEEKELMSFAFFEESEEKRRIRKGFYLPADLVEQQAAFWAKFLASRYRFAAVFGRETEKYFGVLAGARERVIMAGDNLAHNSETLPVEVRGQFMSDLWCRGKNDEMVAQVNDAVEAIERICRPAIEARGR